MLVSDLALSRSKKSYDFERSSLYADQSKRNFLNKNSSTFGSPHSKYEKVLVPNGLQLNLGKGTTN